MFAAAMDDDTKKIAKKFAVEEFPALFLVFAGYYTSCASLLILLL